jgi:putative membrane protein
MGALKHVVVVAWCTGIAACIGLTAWSGIDAVGNAVASVGWGMAFVVLTRAASVSVAGVGWWLLFPARGRLRPRAAVLLRFIREAVNALLPLTQVGGDIIGARLLTFWAVPGPLAAASMIIDVLIQAATQFLFAALGLVMLVALGADMTVVGIAATGLALAVPMLGGFYLAQRGGGHRILHFVVARLKGDGHWRVLGTVDAVYQSLSMIYARRSNLVASSLVHAVGWVIGVTEVLIVLSCMGHPVTIGEALVIESLVQAVRGAAFAIPSALGAQETGLILLCGIFGIPPDQALALSLIKRAADLALGVPGLVALQVIEGERLTAKLARRRTAVRRILILGEGRKPAKRCTIGSSGSFQPSALWFRHRCPDCQRAVKRPGRGGSRHSGPT